jgi:sulfoxide reductase heme-binding subunit YedZ
VVLLKRWLRYHWLEILTHAGALAPLAWIVWYQWRGLFIDSVRQVTKITGRASIVLLVLTLACTPISTVFGWKRDVRVRRALGVYTFLYVALHFLVFSGWDYGFQFDLLGPALFRQSSVTIGLAAFVLLIPLAITSTKGWQRRLGSNWTRLHWLFYPAAILAALHFLRVGKDPTIALRYAVVVGLLLVIRLPWLRKWVREARRRFTSRLSARSEPRVS